MISELEEKYINAFNKAMIINNNFFFSFKKYEIGKVCINKSSDIWEKYYVSQDGIVLDYEEFDNIYDLLLSIFHKLSYIETKSFNDFINIISNDKALIKKYGI